jgi:hypothetical protein
MDKYKKIIAKNKEINEIKGDPSELNKPDTN